MWAMAGHLSREVLSFEGRMVVHPDRAELEFLIGDSARLVELTGSTPEEVAHRYGRPAMLLRHHPDMAAVTWPLDRKAFRS